MPPRITRQRRATQTNASSGGDDPTYITGQVLPEHDNTVGRSAWDMVDHLKLLVYGASGTGKTRFWSTFPGRILAIIVSGGRQPGELKSIDTPANRRRINARVVSSSDQIRDLVNDSSYDLVVLDHASGLQDLCLKETLGIEELPAQTGWGFASQEQYGRCALQCKEMFRALLSLSTNVVIVAQERTFNSKEEPGSSDVLRPTVGAALMPSVTGWLNPACDYVVQTFKRPKLVPDPDNEGQYLRAPGVDYCLRTEPHDVYMTKFRVPIGHELPDVIVNPTYDKLLAVIKGTQPKP